MILLQPFRWCCVDCVIHHERDVREEQKYEWHEQAIIKDCDVVALPILTCERLNSITSVREEIATHDLYCCLLLQCEALGMCRPGFPIATIRLAAGIAFSLCFRVWNVSLFPLEYSSLLNRVPSLAWVQLNLKNRIPENCVELRRERKLG